MLWGSGAFVVAHGHWNDVAHDIRDAIGTALLEELLSRAVIFHRLNRALGRRWAYALSAAAFGDSHLANADTSYFAGVAISVGAGSA